MKGPSGKELMPQMDDNEILDLFFARDEDAIKQTEIKYGDLCHYIASQILIFKEDREECVNDVLLSLWEHIPPERPQNLRAYIGMTTRNRALNKSRSTNAWKRGANVYSIHDDFVELLDDGTDLAADYEAKRAGEVINNFLGTVSKDDRKIFVLHFWLSLTYREICERTGFGESKIKMSIKRTKKKLETVLKKEGITV